MRTDDIDYTSIMRIIYMIFPERHPMRFTRSIHRIFTLFALCAVMVMGVTPAQASPLHIDITRGNVEPVPIAVPDLPGSSVGAEIMRVVAADLERSGLFRPIAKESYIEQISLQTSVPRFADW